MDWSTDRWHIKGKVFGMGHHKPIEQLQCFMANVVLVYKHYSSKRCSPDYCFGGGDKECCLRLYSIIYHKCLIKDYCMWCTSFFNCLVMSYAVWNLCTDHLFIHVFHLEWQLCIYVILRQRSGTDWKRCWSQRLFLCANVYMLHYSHIWRELCLCYIHHNHNTMSTDRGHWLYPHHGIC